MAPTKMTNLILGRPSVWMITPLSAAILVVADYRENTMHSAWSVPLAVDRYAGAKRGLLERGRIGVKNRTVLCSEQGRDAVNR